MTTTIFVKVRVPGTHFWEGAPDGVTSFLRNNHRHEFVIVAHKKVNHNDRDVEFFDLQKRVKDYIVERHGEIGGIIPFGAWSCEMIALNLVEHLDLVACEVSEDGENGAIVQVDDNCNCR